jgi:hypothetical protein
MTKPVIILSLIFLFLVFALHQASASSDEYIRGYAEAVLEKEFHIRADSLKVENGIIEIRLTDSEQTVRDEIIAELSRINGVELVEIIEVSQSKAESPLVSGASVLEKEETIEPFQAKRASLREKHLFRPLIADPRWPHFSIAYQYYIDDEELKNVGFTSFGETLPLYREKAFFGGLWQIGIQAAVFAIFDLEASSKDLINADYWVGIPLSYRKKNVSSLVRLFHQSSHLGDEFLLRNRVDRINVSYEALDIKTSYELSEWLRMYAGSGFILRRDPEDLKQWSIQYGFELKRPGQLLGGTVKPVGGADFKNRQESDWNIDVSLKLGIEIQSEKMFWNQLHLMLEYFNGYSPHGQFYDRSIEYLSLASHFYF